MNHHLIFLDRSNKKKLVPASFKCYTKELYERIKNLAVSNLVLQS